MALGGHALSPLDVNTNNNNAQSRFRRQQSNLRKQSDYQIVQQPIAKVSRPSSDNENLPPQAKSEEKASTPADGQMNQTPIKKKNNKKLLCSTPPVTLYSKKSNTEYDRGRQLGEGGFARCYLVQNRAGEYFAVKTVAKKSLQSEKMKSKFFGEIQVHKSMAHPNIVRYVECFEDEDNIYMILELCQNKSLVEMIRRRGRLTEPEARFYMLQILGALKYMHSKRVIHRDLKLGNIFLDDQMNIKIGDFGLAALLADENDRKTTMCGTPNYIAPEVLFGKKGGHSFEVDLWSCGVILYALLVGKPPFQAADINTIYQKIRETDFEWPSDIYISTSAKELVHALLDKNPQKRPSLDSIADFAFFKIGFFPRLIPSTATKVEPVFKTSTGVTIISGSVLTQSAKADSRRNYLAVARSSGIGVDEGGKPMSCVGGDPERPTSVLAFKTENAKDMKDVSVTSTRPAIISAVKETVSVDVKPVTKQTLKVRQTVAQEKERYMLPESLSPRDGHARMRNAGLLKNIGRLPALGSARDEDQDIGRGLPGIPEEQVVPPPKMAKLGRAPSVARRQRDMADLEEEKDEIPTIAAVLAERPRRGITSNIVPPKLPNVYSTKSIVTRKQSTTLTSRVTKPDAESQSSGPVSAPYLIEPIAQPEPVSAPVSTSRPRRIVQPSVTLPRQIRTIRSTLARPTAVIEETEPAQAPKALRRTRSTVDTDRVPVPERARDPKSTLRAAAIASAVEEPADFANNPIKTGLTGRPRRAVAMQDCPEPTRAPTMPRPSSSSTESTASSTKTSTASSRRRQSPEEAATATSTAQLSPVPVPSTTGSSVIGSAVGYYNALTAVLTSNLSGLGPAPKETLAATRAYKMRESSNYPYITAWADFTNKYGIAYLLADGAVGNLWNDNTALISDSIDETGNFQYFFEGKAEGKKGQDETAFHMVQSKMPKLLAFAKDTEDESLKSKIKNWKRFKSWMVDSFEANHRQTEDEMVWVTTYAKLDALTFFRLSNGTMQFNFRDHIKIHLADNGRTIRFIGLDKMVRVLSLEDTLEIIQAGNRAKRVFVEGDLREKLVMVRRFLRSWIKSGRVCNEVTRKVVKYGVEIEDYKSRDRKTRKDRDEKPRDENGEEIIVVLGDLWGGLRA